MKQNLENEMRDKSLTGSGTRSFENHGAYLEIRMTKKGDFSCLRRSEN